MKFCKNCVFYVRPLEHSICAPARCYHDMSLNHNINLVTGEKRSRTCETMRSAAGDCKESAVLFLHKTVRDDPRADEVKTPPKWWQNIFNWRSI